MDHTTEVTPAREQSRELSPRDDHCESSHECRGTHGGTPTSGVADVVSSSGDLPHRSPHMKLPKLSLKKFNGELTKWTTFWDTFESVVHTNPVLSDIDKFNYLTSLLESTKSEAIAGLTLAAANYDEAVATLRGGLGTSNRLSWTYYFDLNP